MKLPARHWVLLSLLLAAVAAPALAAGTGPIGFYADVGNPVGNQGAPVVRPPTLLLAEDGSVALVHLQWKGWGTAVAQATGVWSASTCTPSCATGKRVTAKATLTLSSPGMVNGQHVYRCFRVSPPHKARDMADQGCLAGQGAMAMYGG